MTRSSFSCALDFLGGVVTYFLYESIKSVIPAIRRSFVSALNIFALVIPWRLEKCGVAISVLVLGGIRLGHRD